MTNARRVLIEIAGDAVGLGRALTDADGMLGRFGSGLGRLAVSGGIALAGLGVGAALAVPDILSAGTAMQSLEVKAETVFAESLPMVQAWSDANAAAMGLTRSQATGLAAGIGDLLVPMGATRNQAGDMSTEIMGMAGALSAWSGGQRSVTEVSGILTDAIMGQRDALQGLGIDISAEEVAARALAVAQAEGRSEITRMDEALATQQLLVEKSTDAQAAWANGSMNAVQSQNRLRAAWNEGKEALIAGVTPALQAGVALLVDRVIPGVEAVTRVFREEGFGGALAYLGDKAREVWPDVQAAIVDGAGQVLDFIQEYAPVLAAQLGEWGLAFVRWIGPQIPPALAELGRFIGTAADWIIDTGLPMAVDALVQLGGQFVAWVGPQIPPLLVELAGLLLQVTGWIITEAAPAILTAALELGIAILSWLPPLGGQLLAGLGQVWSVHLWPWLSSLPGRAADAVGDMTSTLVGKGMDLLTSFLTGIIPGWALGPLLWLVGLGSKVLGAVGDMASTLYQIGRDIIQGLWDGMRSIWDDVSGWLSDRAGDIAGTVGNVLGISSPSRVMFELGRWTGEGFRLGLEAGMPSSIAVPPIDPTGTLDAVRSAGPGSSSTAAQIAAALASINLTVQIGDRDITDIVDVQLDKRDGDLAAAVAAGRRP